MKKVKNLFLFLLVFFSVAFIIPKTASAATPNCVPHFASCDHTLPCCDAATGDVCSSNNICEGAPTPPNSGNVTCGSGANLGIETAIGCIRVLSSPETFLGDVLKWAVGIGGGVAFLLIIYAGFLIMTATGDPKRIQAGQELLTSALGGLILLILSVFVLKFIGVDILGLCKFGFGPTC